MITLFRLIRLWQLKTKWRLAFWQYLDQQATELLKHPEELEQKIVSGIARMMQENDAFNHADPTGFEDRKEA